MTDMDEGRGEAEGLPGGGDEPIRPMSRRWRFAIPAIPVLGAEITTAITLAGDARVVVLLLVPTSAFLAGVTGGSYAVLEAKRMIATDARIRRQNGEKVRTISVPSKEALRRRIWMSNLAEVTSTVATGVSVATSGVETSGMVVVGLLLLIAVLTTRRVWTEPARLPEAT